VGAPLVSTQHKLILVELLVAARIWGIPAPDEQGRDIYRLGSAEGPGITVRMPGWDEDMPASHFRCAECHGYQGLGTVEAGLRIPAIHNAALLANRNRWGGRRTPYNDALLARAITGGINSDGKPLHRAMPRYRMAPGQLRALVAYLRILNTDRDVEIGVSEASVRFGAIIPPNGEPVRAAIERVFSKVNGSGGVYGRRLELVTVEDETAGAAGVSKILGRAPFALLSSYYPGDQRGLGARLRTAGVPSIGPPGCNTQFSFAGTVDDTCLTLARSDEAAMLTNFVAESQRWRRAVMISPRDPPEGAPVIPAGSDVFAGRLAYADCAFPVDAAERLIREGRADAVVFLGRMNNLRVLTSKLASAGLNPAILAPCLRTGSSTDIAKGFRGDLYATSFPREGQIPMATALAEAEAETAVQALKAAGPLLSRPGFAKALALSAVSSGGSVLPANTERSAYVVRLGPGPDRLVALSTLF